ncbi:Lrp/AsnC family transcriptional regulator [Candidatus Woesearchaeota archaeon]|nr:Lrp/AsnC family transcriptional regulator [Candidatus Woesearchaeota archaeon]
MTNELDTKDRKILLTLDMAARMPESTIAKRVGLSKQVTNYRIKRLEEKRIIKGYTAVIDHTKLGLQLYRVWLKIQNAYKQDEKDLIDYLQKHASWFTTVLGDWDIGLSFYAEDEYDFQKKWKQFYDLFGYFIEDRRITLMTTFWNFERSFILPEQKDRDRMFILGKEPGKNIIDDTDKNILAQLTRNAKQTSLDIAKAINQTERVVRYRIKKLEENKIILGYRTFLNTDLLGMRFYKLLIHLKDAKSEDIKLIRNHMTQHPNVAYSTEALGGPDFELEAHFKDSIKLHRFITTLKETFPNLIRSIEHMEYIEEMKVSYYPKE